MIFYFCYLSFSYFIYKAGSLQLFSMLLSSYFGCRTILISINIAVFLFELASPVRISNLQLFSLPLLYGAKINDLILVGEWWRLVTPMFLVQPLIIGFVFQFCSLTFFSLEPKLFLVKNYSLIVYGHYLFMCVH